jgi:hypothetical protein
MHFYLLQAAMLISASPTAQRLPWLADQLADLWLTGHLAAWLQVMPVAFGQEAGPLMSYGVQALVNALLDSQDGFKNKALAEVLDTGCFTCVALQRACWLLSSNIMTCFIACQYSKLPSMHACGAGRAAMGRACIDKAPQFHPGQWLEAAHAHQMTRCAQRVVAEQCRIDSVCGPP